MTSKHRVYNFDSHNCDCLSALHSWFCHNGLALDSSKSEFWLATTNVCVLSLMSHHLQLLALQSHFQEPSKCLESFWTKTFSSMSPHYHATSIFTPVCSVILGMPWRRDGVYGRNSGCIFGAIQVGLRQLHYVWNVSIQHAQTTVFPKFSQLCGSAFSSPSSSKWAT